MAARFTRHKTFPQPRQEPDDYSEYNNGALRRSPRYQQQHVRTVRTTGGELPRLSAAFDDLAFDQRADPRPDERESRDDSASPPFCIWLYWLLLPLLFCTLGPLLFLHAGGIWESQMPKSSTGDVSASWVLSIIDEKLRLVNDRHSEDTDALRQDMNVQFADAKAQMNAAEEKLNNRLSEILPRFEDSMGRLAADFDKMHQQVAALGSQVSGVKTCCDNIQGLIASVEAQQAAFADLSNRIVHLESMSAFSKPFLEKRFAAEWKNFNQSLSTLNADIDVQRALLEDIARTMRTRGPAGEVDVNRLREYINTELARHDADKTGLADYALASSGAEVLTIRCTEPYRESKVIYWLRWIPYWSSYSGDPRNVITPDMTPGQCWAFKGLPGVVVIKLARYIRPTSISIEHIPKSISPTGHIKTAPKDFQVYALRGVRDLDGRFLLNGTYEDNDVPLQSFGILPSLPLDASYHLIELRVLSNHGNADYTCVYRVRVHGVLSVKPDE